MNTNVIRQKLHSYLEVADDKKVHAIYSMIEEEVEGSSVDYSDELKAELDNRFENYQAGKIKALTAEESKKRIQDIMLKAKHNEL
jgi:putative addiction module component (TIGR02574 family)